MNSLFVVQPSKRLYEEIQRVRKQLVSDGEYVEYSHRTVINRNHSGHLEVSMVFNADLESTRDFFRRVVEGEDRDSIVFRSGLVDSDGTIEKTLARIQSQLAQDSRAGADLQTSVYLDISEGVKNDIRGNVLYDNRSLDDMDFHSLNELRNDLADRLSLIYHYMHLEGLENTKENVEIVSGKPIEQVFERVHRR